MKHIIPKGSKLLPCDSVVLGEYFLIFLRIIMPSSSDYCLPRSIAVQNVKVYLQVRTERGLSGWQTNGSGHNMHWVRCISLPPPLTNNPWSLFSVHTYITHIFLHGYSPWTTRIWRLKQCDPSKHQEIFVHCTAPYHRRNEPS